MTLSLADLQRLAGAMGFRSETLEAPGNEGVDRVRKLGLYLGAGPTKPSAAGPAAETATPSPDVRRRLEEAFDRERVAGIVASQLAELNLIEVVLAVTPGLREETSEASGGAEFGRRFTPGGWSGRRPDSRWAHARRDDFLGVHELRLGVQDGKVYRLMRQAFELC